MPFYEALKLLMTEPGKHHFRRKIWEKEYTHNDTKFIASLAITPINVGLILVHKSNDTGYAYYPTYDDITASDWYEVEM